MSDPVTNVEIEDVLSSIRRLVSDEERGRRNTEWTDDSGESDEGASRQAANKLVLTPAQRVDESRKTDPDELGDVAAEAAEYEIDVPQGHGADVGLDGVEDAEVLEDPAPADASAPEASVPEVAVPEVETAQEATEAAAREDIDINELKARIAGFEAAVAQQDDEWEPDGSIDDDLLTAKPGPLPWQDEAETAASGDDAPETAAQDSAETPPPGDGVPDRASSDASGETSEAPPDMSEGISGGQAGPKAGSDPTGDAEPATEWYADDGFLDEDALRDMVSEIVRQELQGELGERITRNVRKLVRREIHRALLSQGIE